MASTSYYRSGLIFSVGDLINTAVDLQTVVKTQRSSLNRLCPDHVKPLKQQLLCEEGDHVVAFNDHVSGKKTPEGYVIVDRDEKPSFEASESIKFTPVPRKEFEANALFGDGFYYATPSSDSSVSNWTVLTSVLKKVALVGKGQLRKGTPKLWALDMFRDTLVLREVTFPDTIKPAPTVDKARIDRETASLVGKFVDNLTAAWDDVDTDNTGGAALQAWLDAGSFVPVTHQENTVSLLEALKQAIEG